MKNRAAIKERYLTDDVPVRLGGLASNLSRVSSFSKNQSHYDVVIDLMEESKFFIEWTGAEVEASAQADLIRIQVDLSRWQIRAKQAWDEDEVRNELSSSAKVWSDSVLRMSGLLEDA